jgi:phosphate transport system permease protein
VSDVIARAATPPDVTATTAGGAPGPAPPSVAAGGGGGTGAGIHGSAVGDRIYSALIWTFAVCVPVLLVLIALEIFVAGWPALHQFGFGFLTSSAWDPVHGHFGAAPAIYGTLVSSAIALVLATPLAIGVSVFLSEFAPPWLRQPVAFFVDLLAAIPSVVYGLWGIFVLLPVLRTAVMPFLQQTLHLKVVPLFSGPAYGPSMLGAGLILAIMVLPYIASVSRGAHRRAARTA